jgi:nucleotide-binding universal stress UspA family protein
MIKGQQAAHPQRILVGVDGSSASLEALRWAVAEARAHGGGDIRAVLVWTVPFTGLATSMAPEPYGLADSALVEDESRLRLKSAIGAVGDTSPVKVRAELIEGHPADVLRALSHDADLVVVGSRGHGGFTSLLLGSVSAQVVRHAHCSVVVVRPQN